MNGRLGSTTTQAGIGNGAIDSQYASVTSQAGIYAGKGGYTVDVKNNTHLQGAVIDSTAAASKNKLTTGALTMKAIENKAEYTAKGAGLSYTHYGDKKTQQEKANTTGLLPSLTPGAQNNASSTTTSAISPGTITTTKETTDISNINRDTRNALNTLGRIFDKKNIEERQEIAKLFAKNAYQLLHHYDRDGKFDKAVAHGIVAEITTRIAGNQAYSGFAAGFTNEMLVNKIKEWLKNDPVKAQWISASLGAMIDTIAGHTALVGGAVAQYGIKWNGLDHFQQSFEGDRSYPSIAQYLHNNLEQGKKNGVVSVLESAYIMSRDNPAVLEVGENDFIYTFNRAAKYLGLGYRYNSDFTMTENLREILRFYAKTLPYRDVFSLEGHLGIGLGIKSPSISAKKSVYLNISNTSPLTINNETEIGLLNGYVGIGAETSYNPQTNSYTQNGYESLKLKYIGTTEKGKDIYISIGGEVYVGGGGGVFLHINTTKIAEEVGLLPETPNVRSREYIEKLIRDKV